MDSKHPIIEPNFDGEAMKMPTVQSYKPAEAAAPKSIISLPIIVLLVLILVAILGGFYYWYTLVLEEANGLTTATRPTAEQNNEPESTTAEARTETLDVVSTSNELPAIRADLESTSLTDLDTEVAPIESELNAALPTQ